MAKLDTDLSVSPYFDDFDTDKNFYRILFRPATAVQARELTQLQTNIQEQIIRHADYVFKDGSIVDGCAITYLPKFNFIRLTDQFTTNTSATVANTIAEQFLLTNGTDGNTAVRAVAIVSKNGFEAQYPATNRVYLNYIASGVDGANNEISSFTSGDTIHVYNTDQSKLGALVANNLVDTIDMVTSNATVNAVGQGYGVTVGDGSIYQKGYFQRVEPQTIIVKDFDTNPNNYVVGFQTVETIVTPEIDSSLYDNALGSSNENAPGAHRLKLTPTLVSKTRSDSTNNTNFFTIVEFDAKQPTQQNTGEATLNKIREVLATRTYDESGNYVVKPFTVEAVAHSSNNELFEYEVSSGIAYVNGYRVEKTNTFRVETTKASTFDEAQAQIITTNFGNYVVIDEVVGVFDFDNLDEIALYNTAQNSISDYEGSGTAPSGSIIGYANVRGFQYASGDKGTPDCQYNLYIFNIRMNSGQSFSNVKSVYGTSSFGNVKADIVLESDGSAQIKDPGLNSLVFPTGYQAIKRLRDASGVNDNQFIFRDITSATIAANGVVTFTINTPANGGNERLNASAGVLSDTTEQNFNIILSSAAYSANLAGTVDTTNANGVIIDGTSTSFDTNFIAGDLIRVNHGSGFQIREVVAVTNSTQIIVDADITQANTVAKYQKYYVAGHVVNTSDFSGTITVLSNTQFTVDTNLDVGTGTLDSGTQTVYAEYQILRTAATETAKEINKSRYVKIDCSNNAANTVGPWDLGFTDLHKVRNIYVGTTYANTNPERTAWFTVDNGQRDSFYDHGRLILKREYKGNITAATKILVELDYFDANTTGGIGYFSVDSYPIDDANTANTTAIQTAEIPVFYSSVTDRTIDLRNSVDFRPRKFSTATDATTIGTATINPAVSNTSFDVPGTGQYIADPDTNFQTDLEFYLPRVDLLVMNREGKVVVRNGEPSENPVEPKNERDTALLARADVTPYPSLSPRQAVTFNRPDLAVQTSIKSTKRYTMKDIRALEDRISRMEYYTTLNLLEQNAKDLIIPDANGIDRFKNGIFADSFHSHLLGKVDDIEYSIAIDKDSGIARPLFDTHSVDFQYDNSSSSGVVRRGRAVMRTYTHETHITQRFATKFRNCTQSVWKWEGKLSLFPQYDHFRDENSLPAVNVNLDLSAPWQDFVNSPFGTNFGDWRITDQTVESQTSRQDFNRRRDGAREEGFVTNTRTTTTTNSERVVNNLQISGTTTDEYTLGTYVADFAINPFMRSRLVAFKVSGLKPNTVMHAFFDGINVDTHCAPGSEASVSDLEAGREDRAVTRTNEFGEGLRTDSEGNLFGVFRIPAETFRVGDRPFHVSNVSNLETGADAQISFATQTFTASSVTVTKQTSTLTTTQPELLVNHSINTRTAIDVDVNEDEVITNSHGPDGGDGGNGGGGDDPIAQSFKVIVPGNNSGMFVTKIGAYFQSKDPTLGVELLVCETVTGLPNTQKIIGRARLESASVNTSTTAATETQFEFDQPIFLSNLTEYAFIVKPDGNSPEYNIWCSETGGFDVVTDEQVFQNPYSGILFVSANFTTWTALQTEDIKFNLYRASFSTGEGTAVFNNEDDEFLTIDGLTKANTLFRVEAGDVVVRYDTSTNTIISDTGNTNYAYATVQYVNEADGELVLDGSNGAFGTNVAIQIHRPTTNAVATALSNTTLIADATCETVNNVEYHAVVPRFLTLEPAQTSVSFEFKGSDDSYVTDSNWHPVINDYEYEFIDKSRYLASKTNEVDNKSGDKTGLFRATLQTKSTYVSPVIDLKRKASLFVENKINNDLTDEHTKYGNATTKYISRNVVLDNRLGNAEDMKVFVGGYRPVGTDIDVYVKVYGSDDGDPYNNKLWTKMVKTTESETVFSSPVDINDMIEYEFNMPANTSIVTEGSATTAYLNADSVVQYAREDGSIVVGYNTFNFKVILTSSDAYRVPRLNDIRAIALQK